MKIKSIVFFICTLMIATNTLLFSGVIQKPRLPEAPSQKPSLDAKKPAMPDLDFSEEDLKMFSEFIDSLDQETIDALTAIGEEIIKEADELGIDPFDYIELQAKLQEEAETKAEEALKPEITVPKLSIPIKPIIDTTVIEMIKNLIGLIGDIRAKAVQDKDFANQLIPYKYRLDDLVYYLNLMTHEKLAKYLSEKEFEPLLASLKELHQSLSQLEPELYIPEFSLLGENPYEVLDLSHIATPDDIVQAYQQKIASLNPKTIEAQLKQQGKDKEAIDKALNNAKIKFDEISDAYTELRDREKSHYIFDRILAALSKATDQQLILEEIKKLFKKHEPEALKIQQEREKIEADARKAQEEALKKRALPGRMVFNMPPPQPSYSGYEPPMPERDFFGGLPTYGAPTAEAGIKGTGKGLEKQPSKPGEKKDGKKKKKKKKKKEKKEAEKKKATEAKAKSKVDIQLAVLKDKLKDFVKIVEKNKDVFGWEFKKFITAPMVPPYADNDINKIKELQKVIGIDLMNILVELPSKIKESLKQFKDDKEGLAAYKKAVEDEFKKFEEAKPKEKDKLTAYQLIEPILKFDDKKQLQPEKGKGLQALDPAKIFALTGITLPGADAQLNLGDATDVEAQKLKAVNPDQKEEIEVPDPAKPGKMMPQEVMRPKNYIKKLQDAYTDAKEKVDEDKKKS